MGSIARQNPQAMLESHMRRHAFEFQSDIRKPAGFMGNEDDDFFTPASENAVDKIFVADFTETEVEAEDGNLPKVLSDID